MRLISLNQVFNDGVCRDRVLTPWQYLGTLSNQITQNMLFVPQCPSSDDEPGTRKKDVCWRKLTRDTLWHHVTSQHVTPDCHTRDRNNPEQLSGCYDCMGPSCDIFRLQTRDKKRYKRDDPPSPGCGLWRHVSRGHTLTITELSSGICHRVLWSIFWLELYKGIRLVTT